MTDGMGHVPEGALLVGVVLEVTEVALVQNADQERV